MSSANVGNQRGSAKDTGNADVTSGRVCYGRGLSANNGVCPRGLPLNDNSKDSGNSAAQCAPICEGLGMGTDGVCPRGLQPSSDDTKDGSGGGRGCGRGQGRGPKWLEKDRQCLWNEKD